MALILNIFYGIFGRRKERKREETVGQHEAAIKRLRETEEMLKDKKGSLERNILAADGDVLAAVGEESGAGTQQALQALKRRKRYEKQVEQIEGKMLNVESQREALENANVDTQVLKNMAFAAEAMRAVHENMDVDNVDDQIQAITEQQEMAQDISDVISKPMGPWGEAHVDEDQLMAELEQMRRRQQQKLLLADKKLLELVVDALVVDVLPSAPAAADSALPTAASAVVSPPQEMLRPPMVASTSPLCLATTSCSATTPTQQQQHATDEASDEPVLKRPRLHL